MQTPEDTPEPLSRRERQIAQAYASGLSYRGIAESLGIAPATVRTHLGTIYRKLGVSTKIALTRALSGDAQRPATPVEDVGLPLPDRPSLAVMPFSAISGGAEADLIAAGLTEDITARLNYLRGLVVRTQAAARAMAGEALEGLTAAERLGVRFLLEGSVRLAGDRLRVLAHLVDANKGMTVWTQRFDRQTAELFDIQDEITQAIVLAAQVVLTDGEAVTQEQGGTKNLDAWERFHSALREVLRYAPESGPRARRLYTEALEFDAGYVDARIYRAWTHWQDARSDFAPDRDAAIAACRHELDALTEAGVETANLLHLQATTLLLEEQHDAAMAMSDRAVALGPCKVFGHTPAGVVNIYSGRLERAVEVLTDTVRIYPYTPNDTVYNLALVFSLLGETERGVAYAEEYERRVPTDVYTYTALALAYGMAGNMDAARHAIDKLRARFPFFRRGNFVRHEPFRDEATLSRVVSIIERAGLTD